MKKSLALILITLMSISSAHSSSKFTELCSQLGSNEDKVDNSILTAWEWWPSQAEISDFSCELALGNIKKMKKLTLRGAREFSLEAYSGNTDIEKIGSAGAILRDNHFIGELPSLKVFDAYNANFENATLTGFKKSQPIEEIYIEYSNIEKLVLPRLSKLKKFTVYNAPIKSIESLAGQPSLEYVSLAYTTLDSVRPLLKCPKLKKVHLGFLRKIDGVYELKKKGVEVVFYKKKK